MEKNIKTIKNHNKNNSIFAKKYADNGFIPFSLNIETREDGRKQLKPPKGYNNIDNDNYSDYIDDTMNGMAIRTGCLLEDNYYLILIDIDDKEDTEDVKNGIIKWKQLTKDKKINTPTQKTGNNGLHYLFKIHTDIFENLSSSGTELVIDNQKYSIDFKCKNQFMIVEPSNYNGKKYKWINDFTIDVQEMPQWLIDIITNQKAYRENTKITIIHPDTEITKLPSEYPVTDIEKNMNLDDLEKYVFVLNKLRSDNYEQWLDVGFCLYNINKDSLYIWKKFSKQSNKYNETECNKKWKTFKTNKAGLKIGSLIYWLTQDDPDKYALTKTNILTQNILNQHRNRYKNSLEVSTIHRNTDHNYIELKDTYCDIQQEHHDANDMYVEMYQHKLDMKCHNPLCRGKSLCEHITIPHIDAKIVFNQYVQLNNNNYYINGSGDIDISFDKVSIFEDDKLNDLIFASLSGKPYDIALVFYHLFGNNINYGDDEKWYNFKNHKWNKMKSRNPIARNMISVKLSSYYKTIVDYYRKFNDERSLIKMKKINNIIDSLRDTITKNNIITELADICSEKNIDFINNLNKNKYLLVFENGVYDLKTFTFRDGIPDDNMSMSFGYDYIDEHTEHLDNLMKFLRDIQPETMELDYILTFLSTALVGNMHELFTIFNGTSRNGKTKFVELINLTFGDFCGTVESQMFTRPKPDASSPNPALLSVVNKKIVIASEPEKNCKLNSGFIKFITGRDTTELRELYKNDMNIFKANFVTILLCNQIPDVDTMDEGFSNRLRSINFPTEFVEEPNINKPYQKKINVKLNEQFDFWKQDFILLLISYYKKYININSLIPTVKISEWTDRYKEDTDIYLSFLNECTEESDTHIKSVTLYEHFKVWFARNNPNCRIPTNKCFSTNIKRHKTIESVKVQGKSASGIKFMKIVEE